MTSRLAGERPAIAGEVAVVERHPEEREAGHEHAGDGARLERHVEAAAQRRRGGLRGADVGAHRDVHADEAGRPRQDRADEEADADLQPEEVGERHEQHEPDDRDGGVLAPQIGLRAFRDGAGNFLHALGAGIALHDVVDREDAVGDGAEPAQDDKQQCCHATVLAVVMALAGSRCVLGLVGRAGGSRGVGRVGVAGQACWAHSGAPSTRFGMSSQGTPALSAKLRRCLQTMLRLFIRE